MHLLLINPNISESVSALIAAEARLAAPPDTTVEVLTAPFGVAYIETRFEAVIGAYAATVLAAEHHARADAVIVAAFGDPGLAGLREALPCPVTGLSEAAFATAGLLGHRFSIVAISSRIAAWYRETVAANGLLGRLASIRSLDGPLADIGRVQQDRETRLVELAERCAVEDGADVVILAGAPLAGLARAVGDRLPVPVVDGVSCAVRQAHALVAAQPRRARLGSFAPPPPKSNQGLPAALADLLARRDAP